MKMLNSNNITKGNRSKPLTGYFPKISSGVYESKLQSVLDSEKSERAQIQLQERIKEIERLRKEKFFINND